MYFAFLRFQWKCQNLNYFLGNKPMLGALFATLWFSVFCIFTKRYLFCFKSMVRIDFGATAREGGRKKYLKTAVYSNVCDMILQKSRKRKTHIKPIVFWDFWGSEITGSEEILQNVTFFALKRNVSWRFSEITENVFRKLSKKHCLQRGLQHVFTKTTYWVFATPRGLY